MARGKNGLPSTSNDRALQPHGRFVVTGRSPDWSVGRSSWTRRIDARSRRLRGCGLRAALSLGRLGIGRRRHDDAFHLELVGADFDAVRIARHDQHDRVEKRLVRIDRGAGRCPHHADLRGEQLRHIGHDQFLPMAGPVVRGPLHDRRGGCATLRIERSRQRDAGGELNIGPAGFDPQPYVQLIEHGDGRRGTNKLDRLTGRGGDDHALESVVVASAAGYAVVRQDFGRACRFRAVARPFPGR